MKQTPNEPAQDPPLGEGIEEILEEMEAEDQNEENVEENPQIAGPSGNPPNYPAILEAGGIGPSGSGSAPMNVFEIIVAVTTQTAIASYLQRRSPPSSPIDLSLTDDDESQSALDDETSQNKVKSSDDPVLITSFSEQLKISSTSQGTSKYSQSGPFRARSVRIDTELSPKRTTLQRVPTPFGTETSRDHTRGDQGKCSTKRKSTGMDYDEGTSVTKKRKGKRIVHVSVGHRSRSRRRSCYKQRIREAKLAGLGLKRRSSSQPAPIGDSQSSSDTSDHEQLIIPASRTLHIPSPRSTGVANYEMLNLPSTSGIRRKIDADAEVSTSKKHKKHKGAGAGEKMDTASSVPGRSFDQFAIPKFLLSINEILPGAYLMAHGSSMPNSLFPEREPASDNPDETSEGRNSRSTFWYRRDSSEDNSNLSMPSSPVADIIEENSSDDHSSL